MAAFLLAAAAGPVAAAVIGTNPPAQPLTPERIAALPTGEQAPWLDYLARSQVRRAADHAAVAAELQAAGRTALIVPREGRGGMPLNEADSWYGGAVALHTADVIVSYQTPNGGWSKNLNMHDAVRPVGGGFIADNASPVKPIPGDYGTSNEPHWNYFGTLDNDSTTTQLRFLAKVITALGPERSAAYRAAFERGLEYLLAAQYPNGGWPQVWPLQGGYHDGITFNDDAVTQAPRGPRGCGGGEGDVRLYPVRVAGPCRARGRPGPRLHPRLPDQGGRTADGVVPAARPADPPAGVGPQLRAPGPVHGRERGRRQFPHEPAPAEPGGDRVGAGRRPPGSGKTGMHDQVWSRYRLDPAAPGPRPPRGITRLPPRPGAGPIWARYYEIGTDRPMFGDRDKSIHDRIEEISVERQNGYQWFNGAGVAMLAAFQDWSARLPAAGP